jgi:hypothetical protein
MTLVRYSGIITLAIVAACSGGGASTGPSGGGGGGGGGGNCPAGAVCFLSSSFTPPSLSVTPGTTVSFMNNSGVTHTLVFDDPAPVGVANIGSNNSGTFTRTFNDRGTFAFHCTIHAGMVGEIVVN